LAASLDGRLTDASELVCGATEGVVRDDVLYKAVKGREVRDRSCEFPDSRLGFVRED